MNRWLVALVVIVTASMWAAMTALIGFPTTWWAALRPFMTAITAAGLVLAGYNYCFWRFVGVRSWVAKTPDLSGTWKMRLQSEWVDPETNAPSPEIEGYAQIDQTASSFILRIFTRESRSETVAYAFSENQSVHALSIVYENRPNIEFRQNRSRFHLGAATFSLRGAYPDKIEGEYWTERKTVGTLTLSSRLRTEINSFQEGAELFGA